MRFGVTEDRLGRVLAAWEAVWVDSADWEDSADWVQDLAALASAVLDLAALVLGVLVRADLD